MSLPYLVLLVFLFNLQTFGNGPTMIPMLQAGLVEGAGVLSQDQLLYAFTIARVTPGQANVYVASIGYMLFGLAGALLTTLAIQLPGYLMLPAMLAYDHLKDARIVGFFTRGLTATSVGLILATVVGIGRESLTSWIAGVVFAVTLLLAQVWKLNIFLSLGIATAVGVGLRLLF